MKRYLVVALVLVICFATVSLVLEGRKTNASPQTVRQYVDDIPKVYGIQRTDDRVMNGEAILGGRVEKGIRKFLHVPFREKPLEIREYLFRVADGGFVVSMHEVQGSITEVVLVGGDFESTPVKQISQSLRKLVPSADFREIISDIDYKNRW